MAIFFSTFHPKEIFFSDFLSYGNSFFLLFILWQPKIEAQKYEIGTPMKNCPIIKKSPILFLNTIVAKQMLISHFLFIPYAN